MKVIPLLGFTALLLPSPAKASLTIWQYATGENAPVGQANGSVSGTYRYDWANEWAGFGTSQVYTIAAAYVGNWPGSEAFNYAVAPGGASWTSMAPNGNVPNLGTFTFAYNFNNSSGLTTGFFDMAFVVDDKVTDIRLNGTPIYTGSPLGGWTSVTTLDTLPVSLLAGTNTLEVTVSNTTWPQGGQGSNMGLGAVYQITGLEPIPEPSAMLLSMVGLGAAMIRRSRSAHAPR